MDEILLQIYEKLKKTKFFIYLDCQNIKNILLRMIYDVEFIANNLLT